MTIETFVITNGRSTFPFVMRSLEEQTLSLKITVVRDMKWVEALNKCLEMSQSDYFVRCDDDHFLHPRALEFMWKNVQSIREKMAMYYCKLWEDWSNHPGGGVKLYHTARVREIGGFHANKYGKVDKVFKKQVQKSKYVLGACNGLLGVHAVAPIEEQIRYEKLWLSQASKKYRKPATNTANYKKTVQEQFEMRIGKVEKVNERRKTDFHRFLKSK